MFAHVSLYCEKQEHKCPNFIIFIDVFRHSLVLKKSKNWQYIQLELGPVVNEKSARLVNGFNFFIVQYLYFFLKIVSKYRLTTPSLEISPCFIALSQFLHTQTACL